MREKAKCSKSGLESRKLETRSNDRLCRILMRRQCISESLIPTPTIIVIFVDLSQIIVSVCMILVFLRVLSPTFISHCLLNSPPPRRRGENNL